MSKNNDNMEPKEARLVRFGLPVDGWLANYAIDNDFKSVPELVRHIVREFKRAQCKLPRKVRVRRPEHLCPLLKGAKPPC